MDTDYLDISNYDRSDRLNIAIVLVAIASWFVYINFASVVFNSPRAIMWGIAIPSVLLGIFVESRKIK